MDLGNPWEKFVTDLGMEFGAQNTCGYGSGSPMSALVPSLNIAPTLKFLKWNWKTNTEWIFTVKVHPESYKLYLSDAPMNVPNHAEMGIDIKLFTSSLLIHPYIKMPK